MLDFFKTVRGQLFFELLVYILAIAIVSSFWYNSFLTFLLLGILWIIALFLWHDPLDIKIFIIAAVGGSLGEVIAISFGAWSYTVPNFLGIPLWLPLLWGFAAVTLRRLLSTLEKRSQKRVRKLLK